MFSSLASYSRWICPTTSWESLLTSTFVAVKVKVRSSPTKIALYSASLLDVRKLSRMTYSLVGDCNVIHISAPDVLEALST